MSIHIIVSVPRSCTYLNGHEVGLGIIAVGVFLLVWMPCYISSEDSISGNIPQKNS